MFPTEARPYNGTDINTFLTEDRDNSDRSNSYSASSVEEGSLSSSADEDGNVRFSFPAKGKQVASTTHRSSQRARSRQGKSLLHISYVSHANDIGFTVLQPADSRRLSKSPV